MELLMACLTKVYHKFSNVRIITWLAERYRNGFIIGNYFAYRRMKKISRKKVCENRPIKVIFLTHAPTAWMKIKSIYENMVADSRFDTVLLALPERPDSETNEMAQYLAKLYGDVVIAANTGDGWFDIKQLMPDYAFYQEPYDQYLAIPYRSYNVARYAKTIYISYGFALWDAIKSVSMNKLFFRNVYLYFAESTVNQEYNVNRLKKSHKYGYQKTLSVGYPIFEYLMHKKNNQVAANPEDCAVLWTPRWSEDDAMGGSNFMTFKDKVIGLLNKNDNIKLIFRPHPMTFSHFIESGRITPQEVDTYLSLYATNSRLEYDRAGDYAEVFWRTDILLTDISSIIVEYLLTEKPIVYCDTGVIPDDFFSEILKCLYVVKEWDEAEKIVLALANGIDPMREKRVDTIKRLFGSDFEHVSERILDAIYSDAHE